MSVDERLRLGLARNALTLVPDVETRLDSTVARRRRDQRIRWAGAGAAAAAACVGLVLVVTGGDGGGSAVPATTPTRLLELSGRYVGEVAAGPETPGAAGTWVLEFRNGGVVTVAAPPTFTGALTRVTYDVDGAGLETDLFGQDLCAGVGTGRYVVSGERGELSLVPVTDRCPQRVSVLASTLWTGTTATGIPDGIWVREVTTAEIDRRGLSLSPEELRDNFLTDGQVRLRLEVQGPRWTLQVEDDEGRLSVGDLGENAYDALGRWVQHSDRAGAAGVLAWTVEGVTLTTSGLTSDDDGEHLFLEGAWVRES